MTEPERIVDRLLHDLAMELVDSDSVVTGRIAETNSSGFGVDTYSIYEARFSDASQQTVEFKASIEYAGDQDPDRPYSGNAISVELTGVAKCTDDDWRIDEYSIIRCETNL